MKEYKVLTVRDVDFKDDQGKQVSGMQLWLDHPTDAPGWNGCEVLKIWFAAGSVFFDLVSGLQRDDLLHITFNRFGRPDSIEVL